MVSRRRASAVAKGLEKELAKDRASVKAAKSIKKNLSEKNYKLDLTPDMFVVKDFYWAMQFEKTEITPKQAASQSGIKPSSIDEWFKLPDVKEWFFEAPLKLRPQLKAVCLMAMRRGREIMNRDGAGSEKMIQYFIDQAQGKAKEKAANSLIDDDDLTEDMENLEKLMEKAKELRSGKNDAEVQGDSVGSSVDRGGSGDNRDSSSSDETNTQNGEE